MSTDSDSMQPATEPAPPARVANDTADELPRSLGTLVADADRQDYPAATLYVIATPIGNRADITVRALACLARVDAVAAEDTRTARQLLHHYGIEKPMFAAHKHNEHEAAATLVARIAGGARIAYVSDAGTPGISDPGARLVAAVREAGLRVLPIPGASALTAAVSAAGLPDGAIAFIGFLPAKSSQAATVLEALAHSAAHLVFYEAPHRIVDTLSLFAKAFGGERHCVIARELTKRFETIHRCRVDEAVAWVRPMRSASAASSSSSSRPLLPTMRQATARWRRPCPSSRSFAPRCRFPKRRRWPPNSPVSPARRSTPRP